MRQISDQREMLLNSSVVCVVWCVWCVWWYVWCVVVYGVCVETSCGCVQGNGLLNAVKRDDVSRTGKSAQM